MGRGAGRPGPGARRGRRRRGGGARARGARRGAGRRRWPFLPLGDVSTAAWATATPTALVAWDGDQLRLDGVEATLEAAEVVTGTRGRARGLPEPARAAAAAAWASSSGCGCARSGLRSRRTSRRPPLTSSSRRRATRSWCAVGAVPHGASGDARASRGAAARRPR